MKEVRKEISREVVALFELIKGGLHNEYIPRIECFTAIQWASVLRLAQQQTVIGIAWDGFLKLPAEIMPASQIKLQWYSYVARVEKSNLLINSVCSTIFRLFEKSGIKVVMFKGQVVAQLYPNPLHRQCGDIDIYAEGEDFNKANLILAELSNTSADQKTMDHNNYTVKGITVELHHNLINIYGKQTKKEYKETLEFCYPNNTGLITINDTKIHTLNTEFHESYVLMHFYRHLVLFGVGLRQLIDCIECSRLVRKEQTTMPSCNKIREMLSSIAVEYLGFKQEDMPHYNGVSKKSEKFISIILKDGNFGLNHTSRIVKKSTPAFIKKLNSLRYLIARWIRVYTIIPGDSIKFIIGSARDLVLNFVKGVKH